nr:hypothetical protein [Tanacetum cinerariifolium]
FRMALRVFGDLEQGLEEVADHLLKVMHKPGSLVHVEETGNLDEPSDVGREQLVVDDPCGKLVPFVEITTVDGNAPLNELVLAGLQIGDDLLCNLS